jgi:hypothetical protein
MSCTAALAALSRKPVKVSFALLLIRSADVDIA